MWIDDQRWELSLQTQNGRHVFALDVSQDVSKREEAMLPSGQSLCPEDCGA